MARCKLFIKPLKIQTNKDYYFKKATVSYIKNIETFNKENASEYVYSIFESGSIDEIKTAITEFIAFVDNLENIYMWWLCQLFKDTFTKQTAAYSTLPCGTKNNVIIVPPEHSPIILLYSCLSVNGNPIDIINGLKKFIVRCDEFVSPIYDAITVAEINRVLNAAQKTYRILDIIAPTKPMYILCFNNSHTEHNSQCGIPYNGTRTATIFLFHLKENGICNRIFIFAHELGHALHLALTGNINIIPNGFDEFNKSMDINFEKLQEKQEAFADAVALAILNTSGLRLHFPTEHSKYMSPYFAKYIKTITDKFLSV